MTTLTTRFLRHATACVAALALTTPIYAVAGGIQSVKNKAQTVAKKARSKPRVSQALDRVENSEAVDILNKVWKLQLKGQLDDMLKLLNRIERDFDAFTGGEKCGGECARFTGDVQAILGDFVALIDEVPELGQNGNLRDNLQRAIGLIDVTPPKALYLMWQAMGENLEELRSAAGTIREIIDSLPPLRPVNGAGFALMVDDTVCSWVESDPAFVELVQARMAYIAWKLKAAADLVPDIEIKAEAGGEAGAAVVNAQGSAGASAKATDTPKITLKALALVPEQINWMIKVNMLRAKTVCAAADTVQARR